MRYTPMGRHTGAKWLMLALAALGIALFAMNIPYPAWRGVWLLGCCAFFMGSAFVWARYVGISITYEIAPRGYLPPEAGMAYVGASAVNVMALPPHMLDFAVYKRQGRRWVTDARLGLGELAYFDLYPRQGGKEREVHKTYPDMKIFNYTASMIPERAYIAVFADGDGGTVGLILEPDTAMASYLSRVAGMQ